VGGNRRCASTPTLTFPIEEEEAKAPSSHVPRSFPWGEEGRAGCLSSRLRLLQQLQDIAIGIEEGGDPATPVFLGWGFEK